MTTVAPTTANLRDRIEAILPGLIETRHDLHAHPELGYEEQRTSAIVRRRLADAGVAFTGDLAGGTGVLGHLPGEVDTATGLRADMDALPIEERTDLPWRSTHPGRMHACGHDGHTTILLGAAEVLSDLAAEQALPRPVTLVFQPAEEGGAGGRRMVEDGCLSGSILGPRVDTMFGLHGWPWLELGRVTTRPGPLLAASDMIEIVVQGRGGHAGRPHLTRDPLLAAAAIVTAMQQISARDVDPLRAAVVSITQLEAGTAHNIVPGQAMLRGTVRTLRPEVARCIRERLQVIVEHVATAHGCTAVLDYHVGYPVTRNDPAAVETFRSVAEPVLGADRVAYLEDPVMGGEDFSYYAAEVPACFFFLGLNRAGKGAMPGLHDDQFDFSDEAIATGVELFCRLALRPVVEPGPET